ncbi:hypothetical protein [Allopontixanthobacter sediminis]|uniref:Phage protein n=1 Tax=Allopontixanthobacter sediminis TaxID=1689985 RepID=A0A845B5P0_9SPHN|nr:hypothetical protein [Allopontixanthobacter sediminis]MXP42959.1 hypothetical protein [Allopontixanthobacter sediminis]
MKNKLSDLNDHLFMQLERLGDEDLTSEQIDQEARRAEAMVSVADRVVTNAALQLKAAVLFVEHGEYVRPHLPMLGSRSNEG